MVLLLQNPLPRHDVSFLSANMALALASDFLYPNITRHGPPPLLFTSSPGSLCVWLLWSHSAFNLELCFWIPHLIFCQCSDWPRSVCTRNLHGFKTESLFSILNSESYVRVCLCVQWLTAPFFLWLSWVTASVMTAAVSITLITALISLMTAALRKGGNTF